MRCRGRMVWPAMRWLLLCVIYLTSPTLGGRGMGGERGRVGTAGGRDMALGMADPLERMDVSRLRGGGGEERPKVEFLMRTEAEDQTSATAGMEKLVIADTFIRLKKQEESVERAVFSEEEKQQKQEEEEEEQGRGEEGPVPEAASSPRDDQGASIEPETAHYIVTLAIKDEKWEVAREAVQKALVQHPKHSGLLCAFGKVLEHEGNAGGAEQYYKQSIKVNSSNADPICCMASLLLSSSTTQDGHDGDGNEKTREAGVLLDKALEIDPNHVAALCASASLYEGMGDFESAEARYRKAASLMPSSPGPLSALARCLHGCERGAPGEARQLYEQVLRLEPKRVSTMCNLASLLVAQGEGEQLLGAEALLKEAVEIDPKSFIANSLLAQLLCERKGYLSSEQYFQTALSLPVPPAWEGGHAAFSSLYCRYAELLQEERKEYDGAIELYSRAIKHDPSNSEALRGAAALWWVHREDAERAGALFREAIELDGGDAGILVQYGSFLCDSCGDLAIAEDAFRRAAEAQPSMFDAVRNLGAVLEGRGADEEAKEMYKRALALSPADEDVQHSIKRVEMGYESLLGAR